MRTSVILRTQQAERLKEARTAAGFASAAAAVDKFRWKQSTYMAHENGQNGLSAESATKYGAAFSVDAGWLLTGVGRGPSKGAPIAFHEEEPKYAEPAEKVEPNAARVQMSGDQLGLFVRDVPVRGIAACGPDGRFEFESGIIDYVKRPPRLIGVKDAYALYVQGDSMKPWRESGQIVYAVPKIPIHINDYVAVQLREHEHASAGLIKRLVRFTAKEVVLEQYNPPKLMPFSPKQVVEMHKILDWSELMGI